MTACSAPAASTVNVKTNRLCEVSAVADAQTGRAVSESGTWCPRQDLTRAVGADSRCWCYNSAASDPLMSDSLRTDPARALDAASERDRSAKIEELLLAGLDH